VVTAQVKYAPALTMMARSVGANPSLSFKLASRFDPQQPMRLGERTLHVWDRPADTS
jgi:hypothetical protein